jgi:hypothetical protein
VSCALAAGESINWVAQYCGTSVTMNEKHHWKWVGGYRDGCARVTSALFTSARRGRNSAENQAETDENRGISERWKVEAGGIENPQTSSPQHSSALLDHLGSRKVL